MSYSGPGVLMNAAERKLYEEASEMDVYHVGQWLRTPLLMRWRGGYRRAIYHKCHEPDCDCMLPVFARWQYIKSQQEIARMFLEKTYGGA